MKLHSQEGNKQSLLAQLTRKHWSTISAMAKSIAHEPLSHADTIRVVSDAVVSESLGAAHVPVAPPRPPRASSLDGTEDGSVVTGTRSRVHSFSSSVRSDTSATSRMQAALYKIPTLQSLFQSLPKHLAFDIEVKYPVEVDHRCGLAPAC
jgi:hypothetical protein